MGRSAGGQTGRDWPFLGLFSDQDANAVARHFNAPWKLNSDRNALIGGEWNAALMREAARLVAETLPSLSSSHDPGGPLDAFPRQLERKDEEAAPLVEAVWTALETAALIPDASGISRMPRGLWRHPRDNAELAAQWQRLAGPDELAKAVHASCLERQRGSRLSELAKRLEGQSPARPEFPMLRKRASHDWFSSVASIGIAEATHVLELAEAFASDCKQAEWNAVRPRLRIIPSHDGRLLTASEAVFKMPSGWGLLAELHCAAKDKLTKRLSSAN